MDDAPKSQDVNQASALRGEPEAAVQGSLSSDDVAYPRDMFEEMIYRCSPYAFYLFQWVPYQTDARRWRLKMLHDVRTFDGREALGIWPNGSHCGPFRDDEVEFIRISRKQHCGEWIDPRKFPEPPQAASGCSHTARSDGPITKFGIKPHSTLAQLKDDEDLRLYVQAHIEEARSAEQGATPPAPAAPKSIHALLSEACTTLEMWADVAPAVSLVRDIRAALAASPQPAAPEGWKLVPIRPTTGMCAASLKAHEGMVYPQDAVHGPMSMNASVYMAMVAAAPATEGGAS